MSKVIDEFKRVALNSYKKKIFDPIQSFQRKRIEIESRININDEDRKLTCELEDFKS